MITSHEHEFITGIDALSHKYPSAREAFECEFNGHWFPFGAWYHSFTMAYLRTAKFRRLVTKVSGEATVNRLTSMTEDGAFVAYVAPGPVILQLPEIFKPGQRVRYTVEVIDP